MAQIRIRELAHLHQPGTHEQIGWLCESLRLRSGRDVQLTTTRLLEGLLPLLAEQHSVSSEEAAERIGICTATLNHHVRNLIDAGILQRERKRITLRGGSLAHAIHAIRHDADRMLAAIEREAHELDQRLGLPHSSKR